MSPSITQHLGLLSPGLAVFQGPSLWGEACDGVLMQSAVSEQSSPTFLLSLGAHRSSLGCWTCGRVAVRVRSPSMLFRGTLGEHPASSLVQIMRCQDPSVSPFISDVSFPRVFHGGTLGAQSGVWLRGEGLGRGRCHPSLPGT